MKENRVAHRKGTRTYRRRSPSAHDAGMQDGQDGTTRSQGLQNLASFVHTPREHRMSLEDLSQLTQDDMKMIIGHALLKVEELTTRCERREDVLEEKMRESEKRMQDKHDEAVRQMQANFAQKEEAMRKEHDSALATLHGKVQDVQKLQDEVHQLREHLAHELHAKVASVKEEISSMQAAVVNLVTRAELSAEDLNLSRISSDLHDRQVAIRWAIMQMPNLRSVVVENRGPPLPAQQLRGTEPIASIDLSKSPIDGKSPRPRFDRDRNNIGVFSATVIADLIKSNIGGTLTQAGCCT